MSRYTNWVKVTRRYKEFAKNIDSTEGEIEYINPAEGELDSMLGTVFTVPFCNTISECPAIISELATDLAYWKAVGIRSKAGKPIKDYIDERLKGLRDGTLALVSIAGTLVPPASQGGGWSNTSDFGSSFGMDDPVNWVPNSAWQQASETARGDC